MSCANITRLLTALSDTEFSYGADGIRASVDDAAQVYDQGLKLLSDGATKYLWGPDGSPVARCRVKKKE